MYIGWPQAILLATMFSSLGIVLAKNGEPEGNHNFGVSVLSNTITLGLLYWGGFFG